ncbi:MAG: BBP7 family outer membrane beta-barrel protein [Pirellulales bacterium]|nr:BBP7 family outer membrane beta-barrel protein [Pirellulales bacterium]
MNRATSPPGCSRHTAGAALAANVRIAAVAFAIWSASLPVSAQVGGGSAAGDRCSGVSTPVTPDCSDSGCSPADGSPAGCPSAWCGAYEPSWPPLCDRLWFRGEYLLWWTKGSQLAPMLTASPAGTPPDAAGVLGQAGTRVLFGDATVNTDARSGERLTLGYWLDPFQCNGIEASYLGMGRETARYAAASPEIAILARPYFDPQTGAEAAMLIAHPDFLDGSANAGVASEFQTVEVLFRRNLHAEAGRRTDFLLGWRYAQLDERLWLSQRSRWTAAQGVVIPGTTKEVVDLFDAANCFNGVELGVVHQEQFGRWFLETQVKLDLGDTHSRVIIDGATATAVPDAGRAVFAGGLLAQETNIGFYERHQLAVIPEVGVTLGCDLTARLRATFGYSFLYWGRVARPAGLVDTSLSQLPPEKRTGAERPAFRFTNDSYWAQGLRFGLDFRF